MTLLERSVRVVGLALLLAAVAGASWWGWLRWDHEYYVDPATGDPAGPYRPWQVVGCVLTLLVAALLAYRRANPALVGVAMTVGFGGAVGASWIPSDDSGLAALGVVLVVAGMTVVATLLPLLDLGVRSVVARVRR